MRQILVDRARRRKRLRHGGGLDRVDLPDVPSVVAMRDDDFLSLDEALTRYSQLHPPKAEL